MYKQSNVTSKLLEDMVKAAEHAKPRDLRSDFLDQIIPILAEKPKTLAEVFQNVMTKKAQLDPMEGATDPMVDDPGLDAGAEEFPAEEMGGEDELGGELGDDLGEESAVGGSLADQLRSLADQVEALEGGPEDDLGGELGDEVDVSGVDEEIPTDTGVGDMVGSEDPISGLPEAGPSPKPMAQPMYMAMANQLKKTAMLISAKGISPNGKRKS